MPYKLVSIFSAKWKMPSLHPYFLLSFWLTFSPLPQWTIYWEVTSAVPMSVCSSAILGYLASIQALDGNSITGFMGLQWALSVFQPWPSLTHLSHCTTSTSPSLKCRSFFKLHPLLILFLSVWQLSSVSFFSCLLHQLVLWFQTYKIQVLDPPGFIWP